MNTLEFEPQERLTIDFLTPDPSNSGIAAVSLPQFIEVFEAFQQAVYAVGAYNLGRRRLRGAARREYTLAIVAYRYASLHVDLQTLTQLVQMQHVLPGLVEGIVSSAAWDAVKSVIVTMKSHFSGVRRDDPLDQVIWRYTLKEATAEARLGYPVRAVYRSESGSEVSFEANLEGAARVLAQDAIERGKSQQYYDCRVKDIRTSRPEIVVTMPRYPDHNIRCEYERQHESDIARLMRIGEVVTIVGTPIWTDNRPHDGPPHMIEIIYIMDSTGNMIGAPSFHRLLDTEDGE